jgi:hypothetical protein
MSSSSIALGVLIPSASLTSLLLSIPAVADASNIRHGSSQNEDREIDIRHKEQ